MMNQYLETRESLQLILDSQNANEYVNGSMNSAVKFYLNDAIKMRQGISQITMSVISFQCPISWYLINSTNNTLVINSVTYTLTPGNYNATTFITAILLLLPVGYGITLNSTTNKFTITYTASFTISSASTMYKILGLAKNTSYSSTANLLTCPYLCNFAGLNRINIHAANLSTRNIDSYTSSPCSIIAAIPINNAQGSMVLYDLKNSFEMTIKVSIIDHLVIHIKDDLGNFIDLNNQHWNLVVQFNLYRDVEKKPSTFLDAFSQK